MKIILLLVGVLFTSCAFAQEGAIAEAASPAASGECGTREIANAARCACYKALKSGRIPDVLLNACRQSFGDNLKSLGKYCEKYNTADGRSSFDDTVKTKINRCDGTYKAAIEKMSAGAAARETPPDVASDITAVSRPYIGPYGWPYPFYWCWGWGWWWWWWILRFYYCWLYYFRFGFHWWWYCRFHPWW